MVPSRRDGFHPDEQLPLERGQPGKVLFLRQQGGGPFAARAVFVGSVGNVAGELLPLRILPTAADHDDHHHYVPGRDAASERWDVSVAQR
jgi:hypothetical protein